MRLVLSFWPVQKDISGSGAACFVFLAGSKGHFEPRCGLFCPFGRFKKTFRVRMQRVLSFWPVQKDISSLGAACFESTLRKHAKTKTFLHIGYVYVKEARKKGGLP